MINVFPRRYILWMMLSCSSSWKISLTHPPTLEFLYWNLSGGQPVSQWNTPTFWIDPTNLEVEWNLARISRARIERGISKQNVKTLLLDRHSFAYIYTSYIRTPGKSSITEKYIQLLNDLLLCDLPWYLPWPTTSGMRFAVPVKTQKAERNRHAPGMQ